MQILGNMETDIPVECKKESRAEFLFLLATDTLWWVVPLIPMLQGLICLVLLCCNSWVTRILSRDSDIPTRSISLLLCIFYCAASWLLGHWHEDSFTSAPLNQVVKFLVYVPQVLWMSVLLPLCILFTTDFAVSLLTENCTDCPDPSKHWILDSCLAGCSFLMLLIMQLSKALPFLFIPVQSFVVFLPVLWESVRSSVLLAGL